jgi:hypothetical protein
VTLGGKNQRGSGRRLDLGRTVRAEGRARDLGELLARLDVLDHGLVEAGQVLVAILRAAGSSVSGVGEIARGAYFFDDRANRATRDLVREAHLEHGLESIRHARHLAGVSACDSRDALEGSSRTRSPRAPRIRAAWTAGASFFKARADGL